MDIILNMADDYVLDKVYARLLPHPPVPSYLESTNSTALPFAYSTSSYDTTPPSASRWERDYIPRQVISIYVVALLGALALYFVFSALSYVFLFDKRLEHHPRFLKNQKMLEVKSSLFAIPIIDFMMLPWFLGEVRGKSYLYERVDQYGWAYLFASVPLFLLFTDFTIYWIHRLEHHPRIYKYIHKPHHKWIIPTPWAAIAFHPVDGYAQALPYHIFVFICPMQRHVYLVLFVLVQLWTIVIHDGDMISGHLLERWINSPAHHTLHHLYFTCNYGQYFTWADSYYQSYRPPEPELDPLIEALRVMRKKGLIDENDQPIKQDKKRD